MKVKFILIIIMIVLFTGCDFRNPSPTIEYNPHYLQTYVNSNIQIIININFIHSNVYNQLIKFKCNNGEINIPNAYGQILWVQDNWIMGYTNTNGYIKLLYRNPSAVGESTIQIRTEVNGVLITKQIKIKVLDGGF